MKIFIKPKMKIMLFKNTVVTTDGEEVLPKATAAHSALGVDKVSPDWEGRLAEIAYKVLNWKE